MNTITVPSNKNIYESSFSMNYTPQTWLDICSQSFNHNAAYYKNKIGKHNILAIVIKGNGYGHGLQQMATLCEYNKNIDWICVAQLSEALALQNITKPILVLGYSDVSPEYAVGKNIHFMVDHLEYAQTLAAIGEKHSCSFNVHIKIDTGLSRMGVLADQAYEFITQLQQLKYITITGLYSHFSASDSNPEFTAYQLEQYNNALKKLNVHNIFPQYMHMGNSASTSTVQYPDHFNFFRVGLGIYGLGLDKNHLRPVMTWKTRIVNIKTVPVGSFISYTGSYQTNRETRIALLPIGYYDGYKFRFSNKTKVLINGLFAPVIGRIAMNITIVDVTDIPAQIHDEVILMGSEEEIHAHTLAELAEIKNVREILTGINPSIARIIIHHD
jgi:alanine racemase